MSREKKNKQKLDDVVAAITGIQEYKNEYGDDADIDVIMGEIGEVKLRILDQYLPKRN
jgi:hypothetical protein